MEDFIHTLLEQIRCRKAWPMIEREIRDHIEEQIADNVAQGMTVKAAEQAAIADMGSPVEAGISLDRVHRPRVAWPVIALMVLIGAAGIVVHFLIGGQESLSFLRYSLLGFVLMIFTYCLDYSVIGRYAKGLALLFLVLMLAAVYSGVGTTNGMFSHLGMGTVRAAFFALMQLYVPLYGAVVYQYHGTGYGGIARSVLWMLVPVWTAFRLPCLSLAVILFVSMALVLSVAIGKQWFLVPGKKVLLWSWLGIFLLPASWLSAAYVFGWLEIYQIARLRAFFSNSGEANYLTSQLREILAGSRLLGGSGVDFAGCLPNFNREYIIVSLASGCGLLAVAAVCCLLAVLTAGMFSISMRQKNQLGMIMGCGCSIVFLTNISLNLLENAGLLPVSQTFLPFFSAGGSGILVCYSLTGMILSIYKYKNIYPKHIDARFSLLKIRTDVEV